jgi:hypothetical protein
MNDEQKIFSLFIISRSVFIVPHSLLSCYLALPSHKHLINFCHRLRSLLASSLLSKRLLNLCADLGAAKNRKMFRLRLQLGLKRRFLALLPIARRPNLFAD